MISVTITDIHRSEDTFVWTPSPRKQPPPPRRALTNSDHPQPPQHPSQTPESSTSPFLGRTPKPIVPPARSEDGLLSKGPPLPPRKSAPATQTSFLPPPRHASTLPTANLPPIPLMPPLPSASSSSAAQQHTFIQSQPPPTQLPPKPTMPIAPVSSSGSTGSGGHATSNLIKQSLQASKVAHSTRRAEEQLEKDRIMQVLKSSNPLASIGSGAYCFQFRVLVSVGG
jgi:collagen type III alpha